MFFRKRGCNGRFVDCIAASRNFEIRDCELLVLIMDLITNALSDTQILLSVQKNNISVC